MNKTTKKKNNDETKKHKNKDENIELLAFILDKKNTKTLMFSAVFVFFSLLFLFIVFKMYSFFIKKKKIPFSCPIRENLKVKKYDVKGNPTEEYQRVKLINFFLNCGLKKEQFFLEYPIKFGHKGKNQLRVDLVIKNTKNRKVVLVVEVKKSYSEKNKYSAIHHQLIPAMRLLECNLGVYYDGTSFSCCLIKSANNTLIEKRISFLNNLRSYLLNQSGN